jgi:purine nucleosidase
LALALVSPELEILGCTTSAGNCHTAAATLNTLRLLEAAGVAAIPVAEGHSGALQRDREPHFHYLEETSGGSQARYWRDLPPPPAPMTGTDPRSAAAFIAECAEDHPGEIVFVALGALTNLALAFLEAPETADRLKGLVHMGGRFDPPDGPPFIWRTPDIPDAIWRTTLRFNTRFDPEAAAVVLRTGIPTTLVPANVTTRVFQRPEHLEQLAAEASPWHRYLATYARPWLEWSIRERHLPGAHMHDPLAVATLVDPSFCRFDTMDLSVPALLAGREDWLTPDGGGLPVRTAVAVDAARFEDWLSRRLCRPILDAYRGVEAPNS